MKKLLIAFAAAATLAGCNTSSNADQRQSKAQAAALDNADRQIGMPRIVNFTQRKLLKNAYEDMDQTILTWVYTQGLDGRFVCLGQALGYGVPAGTQFTNPHHPDSYMGNGIMMDQPEPNGLFVPGSGDATIVDMIDPDTGNARTAMMEPKVLTIPFKLPSSSVSVPCPAAVDPATVKDVKETSTHSQR